MEMRQIRFFLTLARTLNFTRAAEACHVSQPSLSRSIKLLEHEFGAELVRREGTLTHLTGLGRRLLPLLQRAHDAADDVRLAAKEYVKSHGDSLDIAVAADIGAGLLAGAMGCVARAHPIVEINLRRGDAGEVLSMLKKGEAEVALSSGLDEDWDRLESWTLGVAGHALVVSGDHPLARPGPVSPGDLAEVRLLTPRGAWSCGALRARLGVGSIRCAEVDQIGDIFPLLEAGVGAAVIPDGVALPQGLVRLSDEGVDFSMPISLHAVSARRRSPAAQTLIKTARAVAERDLNRRPARPQPWVLEDAGRF